MISPKTNPQSDAPNAIPEEAPSGYVEPPPGAKGCPPAPDPILAKLGLSRERVQALTARAPDPRWVQVDDLLREGKSPDQIAGRTGLPVLMIEQYQTKKQLTP